MKHRSTQSTVTKCQVLGFILLAPGTASLVSPNAPCWQHSTCSVQCGAAPRMHAKAYIRVEQHLGACPGEQQWHRTHRHLWDHDLQQEKNQQHARHTYMGAILGNSFGSQAHSQ